jgi:tetratricopeptide (TPR) repeat protein
MNLGNIEAQKKNYQGAIDNYEQVIRNSPHANPQLYAKKAEVLFSKHLNSFNAYVDAHTNIAVMYVQLDQFDKGFDYCKKSLELKPEDSESLVNFTDILRQLGKKEEAIKHSWDQIVEYTRKHGKPEYQGFTPVAINSWKPDNNHLIP